MRRRTLVTSTGLLLTLVLVGCGGDTADSAQQPGAAETSDPLPMTENPEPMTPPAPEPGAAAAADTPVVSAPVAPAAGGPDPQQVAAGRTVFTGAGLCQACHGPNAEGTALGPNLTDGAWIWISDPSQDLVTQLTTLIRTGIAQPREYPAPMPPMGGASLSDEQLEAVAAYVASLNS
jgi:mono/diheme cytochrome c family protein